MKRVKQNETDWLKIDNAGLIYPSASSETWNNVFRVNAYLKEDVNPEVLQNALNVVIERFPHLDVAMRRGFFWYYFQKMNTYPLVEEEKTYPCRRMELNSKKHLFRVLYFKNKVSFETFHSLTDGSGATAFLNCLLACYFNLLGKNIDEKSLDISFKDKPSIEETEDSFKRFKDNSGTAKRLSRKAYQVYGTPEQNGKLDVITAELSVQDLHKIAKEHNASITQFLVALYAKSILNYKAITIQKKKPVVISVPVNLRNMFGSKSLRNFSSWIDIIFDEKFNNKEIDDLILETKSQIGVVNKEYMQKNINTNVKTEQNFFVRIMPLFLKKIALQISYRFFGEGSYTSVLTNLGKVNAPKEFDDLVERYDCLLCKSIINAINIGVMSFNDNLSITFTSCIKEHFIEKEFCRLLKSYGLDIKIYTNIG